MTECAMCGKRGDTRAMRPCPVCGMPLCDECAERGNGLCDACAQEERYS